MHKNFITVKILNSKVSTKALLDTGAGISCMAETFYNSLPAQCRPTIQTPTFSHISGVGGEIHKVRGQDPLEVIIGDYKYHLSFHILNSLHHHIILGNDFLESNEGIINTKAKTLKLKDGEVMCPTCLWSEHVDIQIYRPVQKHSFLSKF